MGQPQRSVHYMLCRSSQKDAVPRSQEPLQAQPERMGVACSIFLPGEPPSNVEGCWFAAEQQRLAQPVSQSCGRQPKKIKSAIPA